MLLEAKNTARQDTGVQSTRAKDTGVSPASAAAAQPGTAGQQNLTTPVLPVPDLPRNDPVPRQTRRVSVPPKPRHTPSSPRRRGNRPWFSPGRTLARVGVLAGMAGACVVTTVGIWSGNFSSVMHFVNIPVLVAVVSDHYLRYHHASPEVSLERESRPKAAMRMRSYRRNRERARGERRRNRERV
ncbi:hypothetical protein OHB25_58890 [Streptomyces mirabilis]|uniref:hypothetical protein n=1 Tax=Streptomyces mirabilis TaxID=68239 RepID=UPI002E233E2E